MRFISMYSCGAVRAGRHAIFADFDVVSTLLRDGTSVNRLTSVASRSTNYGIVEIPPFSVLWCHGPQRVMWDGTAQTAKMSCRPAVLRDSTKKRLLLFSWVVGRAARPTDDVEPVGRAFGVRAPLMHA